MRKDKRMEQNMTEKRKGTDREDLVVILFGILLAWLIYEIVLKELPETTRVCPGHNEETTIGYEKRYNPFA